MIWTPEDDQQLLEKKAGGASIALIAKALCKTESAVSSRLTILRQKAAKPRLRSDD